MCAITEFEEKFVNTSQEFTSKTLKPINYGAEGRKMGAVYSSTYQAIRCYDQKTTMKTYCEQL
jgi:hypothetical protein